VGPSGPHRLCETGQVPAIGIRSVFPDDPSGFTLINGEIAWTLVTHLGDSG
jgi:hypothetical protein